MTKKNEYYKDALNKTGDREVSENMALQNNLVDLKGEKAPEIRFDGSPYLPGGTPKATNVDNSPAVETLNPYEQMMAQGGTSKFFNMDNLNDYMKTAGEKYEKSVNARTAGLISDAEYGKNAIVDNHNEAYRALRAQNRANINALPGQMTKLGLYGSGTGEVALSNIANDFQNQYNELLKQKNKGIMDIDNQIRQLRQNAVAQIDDYYAQLASQYPQFYLQMLQNKIAAYDSDRNYIRRVYEYDDSTKNDLYKFETGRADTKEQIDKNMAHDIYMNNLGYEQNKELADIGFKNDIYKMNLGHEQNKELAGFKNSLKNADDGDYYAVIPDNNPSGGPTFEEVDSALSKWLYSTAKDLDGSGGYYYNGWDENTKGIYAAKDKIKAEDAAIREVFEKAGATPEQINAKMEEYYNNIARKIAEAEGKGESVEQVRAKYEIGVKKNG